MEDNIIASNPYITRYEDIHQNLEEIVTTYLSKESNLDNFILNQREKNKSGLANSLIELPKSDIKYALKTDYLSNSGNSNGEIGTINPDMQAHEIKNITLLMLMSNRLCKYYKHELETNDSLDEKTKAEYSKNKRKLLLSKDNATSDLIASLYVLEKTGGKKYSNFFSYGNSKDDSNRDTFTIDLPCFGQICVHFGNMKNLILEDAKRKATSILERKKELGQIKESKFKELTCSLDNNILPEYTGKLFEYVSALPLEFIGPNTKEKVNKLGLNTKSVKQVKTDDIQRISRSGLNAREAYYLAVKLGFSKKQLEDVVKVYNEREISRGALKMTTAAQRKNVKEYQNKCITHFKETKDTKSIGG